MRRILARLAAIPALIALLVALFTVPAFANQRDFNLINNTSVVLSHVYVSRSDAEDWGDDILGQDVLNPSETVAVSFGKFDVGSCLYDVKVLGQGGQQGILYKIDLCSVTNVTFSNG